MFARILGSTAMLAGLTAAAPVTADTTLHLLHINDLHSRIQPINRFDSTCGAEDDAAGECFDKSAKLMGLPYPGGPEIQKIAAQCKDPAAALKRFPLPTPMKGRKELDFSFSGLKTAVRQSVEKLPAGDLNRNDIADLSHAFQHTVAEIIADRCARSIERFKSEYKINTPTLVVSGGVAANIAIREKLKQMCETHSIKTYAPPVSLCGDNAAMIAWAGYEHLKTGKSDPLDFKARPRWPLDPSAAPRHGAGVKA